ncbi:MAG: DNA polymerase domain-containing protein [Candidatus Helarchaeota archaeon]
MQFLLDVNVEKNGIALWIVDKNGYSRKVHVDYVPPFYLYSKDILELERGLRSHDNIKEINVVSKFIHIKDLTKTRVLEVKADVIQNVKRVIRDIVKLKNCKIFNIDIPLSQLFLYEKDLFPFARGVYKNNEKLSIELKDDQRAIDYDIPPLKILKLSAIMHSSGPIMKFSDPLKAILLDINDESIVLDGLNESDLLVELSKLVNRIDPDIILSDGGDNFLFPYFLARAAIHDLTNELTLSRDGSSLASSQMKLGKENSSYFSYGTVLFRSPTQHYLTGRLHIDNQTGHFWGGGLDGLIEVARVSRVPVQRLSRITIGGALQSIQLYNALKDAILIPPIKMNAEYFKTAHQLLKGDKGGFIYEPKIGIFDDVLEFDYTSMYPTLMYKYNVSPETIFCNCCPDSRNLVPQLNYPICEKRLGIVPRSVKIILDKRVEYKKLMRTSPKREVYDKRQKALKWILVVSFGYLGFRNAKFGRVESHMAVTAFSRDLLLRAAEIASEKYGLNILHGIVDSLWVKNKEDADENLFKNYCEDVERATKISMNYEGNYKFIIFLPTQANQNIPTLNHYWGVYKNGKKKIRGLEVRRRDAPIFIKRAQNEMIDYFATHAKNKEDFMRLIPRVRKRILNKYIQKIIDGDYDPRELLITTRLTRFFDQYKNSSRQAIAAKQLYELGVKVNPGQSVKYLITDAKNGNSANRVRVEQLVAESSSCDKKEYIKLLKRAFRNLIPNYKFKEKKPKELFFLVHRTS